MAVVQKTVFILTEHITKTNQLIEWREVFLALKKYHISLRVHKDTYTNVAKKKM